jgi:K+-sensing histidine kinase KdpD
VNNDHDAHDAFIRLIAHDLRSPLTAMQLNAQLIERAASQDGREKESRWAALIAAATRRMDRMVQLLVDAERIRSGRIELMRERTVLAGWLGDWLVGTPLGFDKSRLSVVANDRASVVLADTRRLQQALLALVEVVAGATEADAPLSIEVDSHEVDSHQANLRCSMRAPRLDTGATPDRRSQLTAGHEIEIHFVEAVLEAHAGQLQFAVADEDATGFDVILPVASP